MKSKKKTYMDDTHHEHKTNSGPSVIAEFRVKTRNSKIHLREKYNKIPSATYFNE